MSFLPLEAEARDEVLEILEGYPDGVGIGFKYRERPLKFDGDMYEERIRHGSGTYLCRELEGNGRRYRLQMMKDGDGMPWLSLYYPGGHEDSLCGGEHCKWKKVESVYWMRQKNGGFKEVCTWQPVH